MIQNNLKMTAFVLLILFLFNFYGLGSNDRDPRTCATGKNPMIEIDPRHPGWCYKQVNKEEEMKKGIKIFPYSDYISDYSKEALEKIFPVDPQWNEWYMLEKQGNLPKNIRISNTNCWRIWNDISSNSDYLTNRNLDNMLQLISYKKNFIKATQNGVGYYQDELTRLEKEGRLGQWWENSFVNHNPFFFSIYLDTIKKWDQLDKWQQSFRYDAYTGMIFCLLELHKHPYYFSPEMNYLKHHYIPVFWDLYNNPSLITKEHDSQIYNKLSLLGLLHLLGEDFYNLVTAHENLKDKEHTAFVFQDTTEYWDIVNGKVIEVTDLRFKPYLEKRLYSDKKSVVENALLYFYDIGELDKHLDDAIKYCYKNIKSDSRYNGFDILKLLICWRDDNRIKKLAYYYLDHVNEFAFSSLVEIYKTFLITEFDLNIQNIDVRDNKNDKN